MHAYLEACCLSNRQFGAFDLRAGVLINTTCNEHELCDSKRDWVMGNKEIDD